METTAIVERSTRGEYHDRKATLPRRILKLCLRLASLTPGRYVLVVDVPAEGELRFEEAALQGHRQI